MSRVLIRYLLGVNFIFIYSDEKLDDISIQLLYDVYY